MTRSSAPAAPRPRPVHSPPGPRGPKERCQSGRMGRPAKALTLRGPWVQIPPSPPPTGVDVRVSDSDVHPGRRFGERPPDSCDRWRAAAVGRRVHRRPNIVDVDLGDRLVDLVPHVPGVGQHGDHGLDRRTARLRTGQLGHQHGGIDVVNQVGDDSLQPGDMARIACRAEPGQRHTGPSDRRGSNAGR